MNSKKDIQNEIIKAINLMISKEKLDRLPYDKTYIVRIIGRTQASLTTYKYSVIIEKNRYNVLSSEKYSIGDKVRIRIPRNNWNDIYIENKI